MPHWTSTFINPDQIIRNKDLLVYGGSFLFWGIIGYVEVGAYSGHTIQLALTLLLMSSLIALLVMGSQMERFRPELFFKIDVLKVILSEKCLTRATGDMWRWPLWNFSNYGRPCTRSITPAA